MATRKKIPDGVKDEATAMALNEMGARIASLTETLRTTNQKLAAVQDATSMQSRAITELAVKALPSVAPGNQPSDASAFRLTDVGRKDDLRRRVDALAIEALTLRPGFTIEFHLIKAAVVGNGGTAVLRTPAFTNWLMENKAEVIRRVGGL